MTLYIYLTVAAILLILFLNDLRLDKKNDDKSTNFTIYIVYSIVAALYCIVAAIHFIIYLITTV